jgi:hypothetical protein
MRKWSIGLFGVLLLGLLFYGVSYEGQDINALRVRQCESQLRAIGEAMMSYFNDHGSFPTLCAPALPGDSLTPSWRVLLLPYIGEGALYQRYDRSEPWDSATNRRLESKIPPVYVCPAGTARGNFTTNYVAVVISEASWRENRSLLRPADLESDVAVLLFELPEHGVHWMNPCDEALVGRQGGSDGAIPVPARHGMSRYLVITKHGVAATLFD